NNGGILRYATVGATNGTFTDFATYDAANNSVAAFTGYATSIATAVAGDTVKLGGAETLATNKTINALFLANGTVGEAGFTLTLGSGALAATAGANSLIGGNLAFAAGEGIILTNTGAATTINSTIAGSGSLTTAGAGTLNLPNANTYSGGTVLGAGVLNVGSSTALGTGTVT